jgi:hypothetical protein
MNISSNEAEESLAAIQDMTQKTRHSLASSGAHIALIVTGIIWLVGYVATQFLSGDIVAYIWIGITLIGAGLSILMSRRMGPSVRSPSTAIYTKRAGFFWLCLVFYCIAVIAVARPTDGKQVSMFVILFIMIGELSMGLLLSFAYSWWALPITALSLAGYFLLPDYFYLWMGVLVGGSMILLGLYIRRKW